MKKILQGLLFLISFIATAQTIPPDATQLENIQITNNTTSTTATKMVVQENSGVLNTMAFSPQDNIFISKNIYYNPASRHDNGYFAGVLNASASFSLNEKNNLIIIATRNPIYSIGSGESEVTYKYILLNKGKGTYGTGGTTISGQDLELVSVTQTSSADIENNPSTQTINTGANISGTNISAYLNSITPAIAVQSQSQGYVLFKVLNGTTPQTYLFLGDGGTYGAGATQTTLADFQLLEEETEQFSENPVFFNSNNIPSHLSLEKSILNAGAWDKNIREIGNVIKLSDGRLFLTYTGTNLPYTEGVNEFVGGAVSQDNGNTWTKIGAEGKIINTNSEDPFVVVNPLNGLLHMYVEKKVSSFPGFHAGIELFTANISDLNTWTSQGLVLEKTTTVWENKDVSSPTLLIKDGVWYLFYEGRGTNSQEGVIALATSTDGITFTRDSNSPLIYGSQYNNISPTSGWFTHCIPDDVRIIRGEFYLTAHCYNGFTFSEGIFKSTDGINWTDCLNTWVNRSDNDENLGNGLMFSEDNKFIYNSETQLLLGNLISNPYQKFIHTSRSSATGILKIKSGNKNEVITLSITAESNMEFSKGFLDNSGVVKIINNPTNFLAAFTVEGSGKINNEDAFFLPAGESAIFYGVGLNMWNAFKVKDNNVIHKTGYAIETKTGNLNVNGSISTNTETPRGRFDIRGNSDVVAFVESLTAGYGSLFFQSANGGSFFGSLNDTPLVIHSGGIPAISIDPTSRIATFLQPTIIQNATASNHAVALGQIKTAVKSVTTTTTLTLADYGANKELLVLCNASGGAFSINIPASANILGYKTRIMKTDSSANAVTADANGSELINQATTFVLTAQNQVIQLESNSTQLYITN